MSEGKERPKKMETELQEDEAASVCFSGSQRAIPPQHRGPASHGNRPLFFGQAVKTRQRLFLQLVKFNEAEASSQFVDHSFEGDKGCKDLDGEEKGEDGMDSSLQRLDFQAAVEQQEEDYRQLQEETQEPKSSQLGDL